MAKKEKTFISEKMADGRHDMKKAEIPRDRLSTALCTENHIGK